MPPGQCRLEDLWKTLARKPARVLETVQKLPLLVGEGLGGEGFIFNGLCCQRLYKNAS